MNLLGGLIFFPRFWITDGQLHISRPENRGVSLKDNSAPALPVRGPPTCISLTAGRPCKTFFWYGTHWKSKNCYFDRRSTPRFRVVASGSRPKLKRLSEITLTKGAPLKSCQGICLITAVDWSFLFETAAQNPLFNEGLLRIIQLSEGMPSLPVSAPVVCVIHTSTPQPAFCCMNTAFVFVRWQLCLC